MMTPKKFAVAMSASALLLAGPALALKETTNAEAIDEANAMEAPAPALWKVADEDTTIFLFGTIHALPKDVVWYSSTIENALAVSDSIVTEIRMGPGIEQEMQKLVLTKAILPQGTTLRSLLDEEQTSAFEGAMGKLGVPTEAFDQFEPWYAGMMMSMLPLIQQGYSPDDGVDKVLLSKAGDKEQQALETIAFQIGVFDGLPQSSQIDFLVEASEGVDEIKNSLDKIVAVWVKGDADTLAQLMNEDLTDPELAEALLYMRNRNWAEWIDNRLDEPGTVFIAVGAGHLAGQKSVQDILAERGIQTDRVQ